MRHVKGFVLSIVVLTICFMEFPVNATEYTMEDLPSGAWTFSSHPDFRQGVNTVPVLAYSVTTHADKGLKVTGLGLYNRHPNKAVSQVTICWMLTTTQNLNASMYQGYNTIDIPYTIKANSGTAVNPGVPAFAQIAQSMSSPLTGDYWLEVFVVGINYTDGSTWSRDPSDNANSFASDCPPLQHCGKQKCDWNEQALTYVCVSSEKCERCKLIRFNSCNNEHCSAEVANISLTPGGSFALLETLE